MAVATRRLDAGEVFGATVECPRFCGHGAIASATATAGHTRTTVFDSPPRPARRPRPRVLLGCNLSRTGILKPSGARGTARRLRRHDGQERRLERYGPRPA